VYILGGLKLLW